jgi:hypothetical protein
MARLMRDKDFRDDQWERRYAGRVERINRFIDELGAKDAVGHLRTSLRCAEGSTRWR